MARYSPEQLARRNVSVWTDFRIIPVPGFIVIYLCGFLVERAGIANNSSVERSRATLFF